MNPESAKLIRDVLDSLGKTGSEALNLSASFMAADAISSVIIGLLVFLLCILVFSFSLARLVREQYPHDAWAPVCVVSGILSALVLFGLFISLPGNIATAINPKGAVILKALEKVK